MLRHKASTGVLALQTTAKAEAGPHHTRLIRMSRDLVSGLIKIHVLHHAIQGPIFGLAMIRELERHGYDVSPGTLYPMLHGMVTAGFLVCEDRTVDGRRRKYYRATPAGEAALAEIRPMIAELAGEVVADREPASIDLSRRVSIDAK